MTKPRFIQNNVCLKCATVPAEIVLVGAYTMCEPCYRSEFKTDDPVKLERENYPVWLHQSKEAAGL